MKRRRTTNAITAPLKTYEVQPIGTSIVSLRAVHHGNTTNNMSPDPDQALQAKTPSHDQIAGRAKAIWLERGCSPDQDQENWYAAETQLRTELGGTVTLETPLTTESQSRSGRESLINIQ